MSHPSTGATAQLDGTAPDSGRGKERMRIDIQALRAIAVVAVVVYHFWPTRLTGGYVGVDVFFVISGFLITLHLIERPTTSPKRAAAFWGRRIRRLLPAATLVLLVTSVLGLILLPSTMIAKMGHETIAAALYVENWQLANTATDYLAAEGAASPVQHYWSLSVEEQFYVIWPIALGLLIALAGAMRTRRWLFAGTGTVFVLSLAASWYLTSTDPARAYFVTYTRMWELALGGIVAVLVGSRLLAMPDRLRAVLAWSGIALVCWAVWTFDSTTAFPGLAALVPTVGTALVIAADSDRAPGSPRRLFAVPLVQSLGDRSYSIYLWHWPLLVFLPFLVVGQVRTWQKLLTIAVVYLLAALTKTYVEDPVRRSALLNRNLRTTFVVGAVCMLASVAMGLAVVGRAAAEENRALDALAVAKAQSAPCFGAAAATSRDCVLAGEELLSPPSAAAADKSVLYADDCFAGSPFTDRTVCTYGVPTSTTKVALVGNSHAGHWQPALDLVAKKQGWRVDTYLASMCYTVDVPINFDGPAVEGCQAWNRWAMDSITKGGYDLVVISNRSAARALKGVPSDKQAEASRAAYTRTLAALTAAGTPVLVLRDTPAAADNVPDCVAAHLDDVTACDRPTAEALELDPLAEVARADASGLVSVGDPTDLFCREGTCTFVIGGLITYFDHGHLTRTFSETLAPWLSRLAVRRLG